MPPREGAQSRAGRGRVRRVGGGEGAGARTCKAVRREEGRYLYALCERGEFCGRHHRLQPESCDWLNLHTTIDNVRIVFAAQNVRFHHWPQCVAVGAPRWALSQSLTISTTRAWFSETCRQLDNSNVQGNRQRPNNLSSSLKDPWLLSLGIRTPSVCIIAAHDRGSICNLWLGLPRPRRSLGHLTRDAQSHRGRQHRESF